MAASVDNFNDLRELGIDCEENLDSLTVKFNKAAAHITHLKNLDNATLLKIYAYYKQAIQGQCNTPKPSWYDLKAKSKWEAWNELGQMPKDQAKQLYIDLVQELDPTSDFCATESWVSVSVLQKQANDTNHTKTIFDHVIDEDVAKIQEILTKSPNLVNEIDQDGLGLVHWVCDRGSKEILNVLLQFKVDLNQQDGDGQTPLHYASSCGHLECIKLLIRNGANSKVLDCNGLSPVDVACDETVKELFCSLQ